jgi:hypothetical protein
MESGTGAVALLAAARAIRCTRDIIETGTHSDEARVGYLARLQALENWNGFTDDPNKRRFRYQRWLVGRLIPRIFNDLKMRFWAGHKIGFKPTPLTDLCDTVNDKGEGLVEILTKDMPPANGLGEAFARAFGTSIEKIKANSLALENAVKTMRGENAPIRIADDYTKYFQEKSVQEFAVSIVRRKLGTVDPKLAASVEGRLRLGRLDFAQGNLQDCINLYSLMLEPHVGNLAYRSMAAFHAGSRGIQRAAPPKWAYQKARALFSFQRPSSCYAIS